MNRIIREQYPVSKLPEDLREGLAAGEVVRVTIDVPDGLPATEEPDRRGHISRFKHIRRQNYTSVEEAVAAVRSQRDEWPD